MRYSSGKIVQAVNILINITEMVLIIHTIFHVSVLLFLFVAISCIDWNAALTTYLRLSTSSLIVEDANKLCLCITSLTYCSLKHTEQNVMLPKYSP